jgi:hypothetical protein
MATEAVGQRTSPESPHLGPRQLTTLHAVGQALAIGPIFSYGSCTWHDQCKSAVRRATRWSTRACPLSMTGA